MAEATRRLERNGMSIVVPGGWDGRMLFRDAAGSSGVIFQVANFELPPTKGSSRRGNCRPDKEDPIKAMDAGDVLVTVVSDETRGEPALEPIDRRQLRCVPAEARACRAATRSPNVRSASEPAAYGSRSTSARSTAADARG